MGFWNTVLKYGGKAAKGVGTATTATGKSVGKAVLTPSQTLRGAGQAVKTATIGGAVGYVGWEKLTSDKSVVRIVSDAVVGESVTDAIAGTADNVREMKDKAGEAVSAVSGAVAGIDNKLDGVSNFLLQSFRRRSLRYVRQLLPQPRQRQRIGTEHCGVNRRRIPHIRTLRVVRQDCRRVSRHDAYRQQCRHLSHIGSGERSERAITIRSGRGTEP